MRIVRQFTTLGVYPLLHVPFKRVDVDACHENPAQHCCVSDIEVPAHWSYAAAQIFAQHYLSREPIPSESIAIADAALPEFLRCSKAKSGSSSTYEYSARQVFHRMVGAWTHAGFLAGYFDTPADAQVFYDEMCYVLAHQMAAPNSLQWRHTGLHWAYGIEGAKKLGFSVDIETGNITKVTHSLTQPMIHACALQGMKSADGASASDTVLGLIERERNMVSQGAATGANFSSLAAGDVLRAMTLRDRASATITSAGLPRKPKAMMVIELDHVAAQSVLRFRPEEQYKATALIVGARMMRKHLACVMAATQVDGMEKDDATNLTKNAALKRAISDATRALIPHGAVERILGYARAGYKEVYIPIYGTDAGSEAFFTVSAQHSCIGVRVSDAQMRDVSVAMESLMEEWTHSAWAAGEPSLLFADTITDWHTCKAAGEIVSTTPAGEFLFLDDTALPLASINLAAFVSDEGKVNVTSLSHVARLMSIMLDISVSMAQYPSRDLARKTADFRPLGLSVTNLASALMMQGFAYDSKAGRAIGAAMLALVSADAYAASAEMAKELGAFAHFAANRSSMMAVLHAHRQVSLGLPVLLPSGKMVATIACEVIENAQLVEAMQRAWDQAIIWADAYGVRNAQTTCVAPTSTISHMMDAAAMATYPMAQLVCVASQPEKGARKYVHPAVMQALKCLGYSAAQILDVSQYLMGSGTLKGAGSVSHNSLIEKGFGDEQIALLEAALKESTDIQQAFDPFILGERFCRDVLKLSDNQMFDASFDMLSHLGYGAREISDANMYACGNKSVVNAPHVSAEHYAVFACKMGDSSAEYVSAEAQIRMIAALQSCVSGGVAHEVQVHQSASIESLGTLARLAHEIGLKTLSIKRMHCELYAEHSQGNQSEISDESDEDIQRYAKASARVMSSSHQLAQRLARQVMAERRALPTRRTGFTQKVMIGGQTLYLRTGEYESGEVGEVFIDVPDASEEYRALMQQFARCISLAMQYDVPLEALASSFASASFAPNGQVGGSPYVQSASSMIDYVFQELMCSYAGEAGANETLRRTLPVLAHSAAS